MAIWTTFSPTHLLSSEVGDLSNIEGALQCSLFECRVLHRWCCWQCRALYFTTVQYSESLCSALQYVEDDIGGCAQCAVHCILVHLITMGCIAVNYVSVEFEMIFLAVQCISLHCKDDIGGAVHCISFQR